MKKNTAISYKRGNIQNSVSKSNTTESDRCIHIPTKRNNPGKRKLKRSEDKEESKFTRRHWSQKEDKAIWELIQKRGFKKWSLIAKKLKEEFGVIGRSGKQCRERWQNYLDPSVITGPITIEEERLIFTGQRQYGNKWAEIAKLIPGRRDNLIKNHFYSTLRRQLRKALIESNVAMTKCPNNVNIRCIWTMLKNNSVPYTRIENENVRGLLEYLDMHPEKLSILSEDQESFPVKNYNS